MTTQAKALSLLGRHDEALGTLNALLDLAAKGATGDSLGFWKANQIHFAESWVYAGESPEFSRPSMATMGPVCGVLLKARAALCASCTALASECPCR